MPLEKRTIPVEIVEQDGKYGIVHDGEMTMFGYANEAGAKTAAKNFYLSYPRTRTKWERGPSALVPISTAQKYAVRVLAHTEYVRVAWVKEPAVPA